MSAPVASSPSRYDPGRGRSAGFFLALLAESLLVLLVLTFGSSIMNPESFGSAVEIVRFRAVSQEEKAEPAEEKAAPEEKKQEEPQPEETAKPQEQKAEPTPPQPEQPPKPRQPPPMPKIIPLSPAQMASSNVTPARPSAPPAAQGQQSQQFGPPDTGARTGDSRVVSGAGPNGETLYAASWYREPYKDELDGYLSTATGPGWGLIACRTAPDFRVEDCVPVDEYPSGSNINRAILAAAWQFKVRPPQVGGKPRIGEWVRIRIDYGTRRN